MGKLVSAKKGTAAFHFFFRDKRRRNRANRVDVEDEWPPPREDDSKPSLNSISIFNVIPFTKLLPIFFPINHLSRELARFTGKRGQF